MNTAMLAMGCNTISGNPIVDAWVNTEQDYAFLEFRTHEEAAKEMKLDGISLLGKVNIYLNAGYSTWATKI